MFESQLTKQLRDVQFVTTSDLKRPKVRYSNTLDDNIMTTRAEGHGHDLKGRIEVRGQPETTILQVPSRDEIENEITGKRAKDLGSRVFTTARRRGQ